VLHDLKRALELESWSSSQNPGLVVRSEVDRKDPSLFHLSVSDADDDSDIFATCRKLSYMGQGSVVRLYFEPYVLCVFVSRSYCWKCIDNLSFLSFLHL
jgi:hypothetical protein